LRKPVVPARLLLLALIPFCTPVILTLGFPAIGGSSCPRDLAVGSGLELAGLVATLVTAFLAWRVSVPGISDTRVRKMAGVFCLLVGLIGWPVWSLSALPFVNAVALQNERTIAMTLDRTETTTIRLSPKLHHWAWLAPKDAGAAVSPGRYFIPEATYERWTATKPASVNLQAATGLLGATVIADIQ
jgi:hypothetical protein